jgi:sortase A
MTPALRVARTTGEVFVTLGVIILLFVYWLLYWTDVVQHRTQHALAQQLQNEWQDPTYNIDKVAIGHGLAVLRIPRFGSGYHQVIVQGVSEEDLQKGPGHITTTADPGAMGNFVVSGHRTTYGHPFNQLDTLRPDDVVVVETRTDWLTYKVDNEQVVLPTAYDVTEPIPPESGFTKPGHYITFTTCTPKYSASHRLIMFGELVESDPKTDPHFVPKSLRPGVITVSDMAKQV